MEITGAELGSIVWRVEDHLIPIGLITNCSNAVTVLESKSDIIVT